MSRQRCVEVCETHIPGLMEHPLVDKATVIDGIAWVTLFIQLRGGWQIEFQNDRGFAERFVVTDQSSPVAATLDIVATARTIAAKSGMRSCRIDLDDGEFRRALSINIGWGTQDTLLCAGHPVLLGVGNV